MVLKLPSNCVSHPKDLGAPLPTTMGTGAPIEPEVKEIQDPTQCFMKKSVKTMLKVYKTINKIIEICVFCLSMLCFQYKT